MKCILVALLLVTCTESSVVRLRRQLPGLDSLGALAGGSPLGGLTGALAGQPGGGATAGGAGCTADTIALCGIPLCKNQLGSGGNVQVISGGNTGGAASSGVCPPPSVCSMCAGASILPG
ncbi:uncharacterized transmembrane protein DDB_G0289901-like [Paramacrobiotus metropolitanus]|uniref:uncharacterized transmembrane protein DDB_G0289901-like n=1 Tax=Paramacrobiotus metropolitanus TaxID=2943436 RepID=UPI002445B14A|nr:uncharacterized transmembrane protein DDB_G0289901-like [Paramacrobiotus metropolitanus]